MRVAVLILGLVLGAFMLFQTFAVYALSGATSDKTSSGAGAIGILMALLWLIACALVIPLPQISVVPFAVAGVLGIAAASTSKFHDLQIWGIISLVLALLSFFGWRSKRKDATLAETRHQELLAAARREP